LFFRFYIQTVLLVLILSYGVTTFALARILRVSILFTSGIFTFIFAHNL